MILLLFIISSAVQIFGFSYIHYNNNISLYFIEHFNSFILVQERKFSVEANHSYRFLNISLLKYHVAHYRIDIGRGRRTGNARKTISAATFGGMFSNSITKVLEHGFLLLIR